MHVCEWMYTCVTYGFNISKNSFQTFRISARKKTTKLHIKCYCFQPTTDHRIYGEKGKLLKCRLKCESNIFNRRKSYCTLYVMHGMTMDTYEIFHFFLIAKGFFSVNQFCSNDSIVLENVEKLIPFRMLQIIEYLYNIWHLNRLKNDQIHIILIELWIFVAIAK